MGAGDWLQLLAIAQEGSLRPEPTLCQREGQKASGHCPQAAAVWLSLSGGAVTGSRVVTCPSEGLREGTFPKANLMGSSPGCAGDRPGGNSTQYL